MTRAAPLFAGALCIIPLAYGSFIRFRHFPAFWDIALWDETGSLAASARQDFGFANYETTPFHTAIYGLLRSGNADPLNLFFAVALAVSAATLLAAGIGT